MRKEIAKVVSQEALADGIFSMWIETPMSKEALPGQFIAVYTNNPSKLLPRPISICEVSEGKLRIVYRIAGEGTREFSKYKAGDDIAIMGPLGNGYREVLEKEKNSKVFIIGGGIGIPPMLELAKRVKSDKEIILGYRDGNLFLKSDFDRCGAVHIATEDGSAGVCGNVLTLIQEKGLSADVICACGPLPMLRAIKDYAAGNNIKAYISLEERMACGVGACLGCVCKTKETDDHSKVKNKRICTEGPVFMAEDVEI